mmetsp:Transcript_10493/g.14576  ORF Transcript_10493/g.14576 Transcript_10493/m.14576 type:complete len:90 (-) Transcript_10493:136-405(-)
MLKTLLDLVVARSCMIDTIEMFGEDCATPLDSTSRIFVLSGKDPAYLDRDADLDEKSSLQATSNVRCLHLFKSNYYQKVIGGARHIQSE